MIITKEAFLLQEDGRLKAAHLSENFVEAFDKFLNRNIDLRQAFFQAIDVEDYKAAQRILREDDAEFFSHKAKVAEIWVKATINHGNADERSLSSLCHHVVAEVISHDENIDENLLKELETKAPVFAGVIKAHLAL